MSGRLPRISVVTPSFNQGAFLEDAIKSVMDQGYPNLEYIVMDGGSTDGSVEIIQRHAPHLAYWGSEPDDGQAAAIREGFERSTGEILCWLNSDDMFMPGALLRVGRHFRNHPDARWIYGDSVVVGPSGEPRDLLVSIDFDYDILLYYIDYIAQPASFWRRELYAEAGGLDVSFRCGMDADLWLRMGRLAPAKHLPVPLAIVRDHPEMKSRRLRSVALDERARYREAAVRASGRSTGRLAMGWARLVNRIRFNWKVTPIRIRNLFRGSGPKRAAKALASSARKDAVR